MNIDKAKLKKILIPVAIALAGVLATLAIILALVGNKKASYYTVSFQQGGGYTYVTDTKDGEKIKPGESVRFSLNVSVFYTGSPVVFVNNEPILPNASGIYEVVVKKNTSISVAGVNKDVSNMAGSGAIDDAFVVSRPIDLIYIARQVNAGNRTYVNGSYILANDIDLKGEELEVIGDFKTENSYFAGVFSCPTDSETNEMQRHTISNFTINTNNTNYVGLFGCVMVDMSVTSSGLFYGICLDNFTINTSITNPTDDSNLSITCGSLIGYGIGAKTYLCDATNGEINVYADDNYFSFAGGLIGYQQGLYAQEYNRFYPAEVAYSKVDVDINIVQGCALYAGGISGYLVTNYPFAASYIHNSYALGSITGAIRAGGIAGGLGQHTVVSNCYALGDAVAKSKFSATSFANSTLEYCIASAGGLVGYAENDSIVQDSFCAGKAYAYAVSGKDFQKTGKIVGFGPEAETSMANSEKYIEYNCISDAKASEIDTIKTTLGWATYNWVFDLNTFPTINYEPSSDTNKFSITAKFVVENNGEFEAIQVGNKTETSTTIDLSEALYAPIGEDFKQGNFQIYYAATDSNYKGYLSYGYFLDEACTIKMPFSFLPTKDTTVYIAFTDPSPVVGTYYATTEKGDLITLKIHTDGTATYTDGAITQTTTYAFDGETLYLDSARFSRYFTGEFAQADDSSDSIDLSGMLIADITQFNNFEMERYLYYAYKATLNEDGTLPLIDGTYFTKDNPFVASKYKPATKTEDAFKGTWVRSASINKVYVFDGNGNWSYKYSGYAQVGYSSVEERILERASGSYSKNGNTLKLDNGATAFFNSDGFLVIQDKNGEQIYYPELSFTGTWESSSYGVSLTLKGINADGLGQASLRYTNDSYVYELTYEKSVTENFICFYQDNNIFGYATYDRLSNLMLATLYYATNSSSEYLAFTLMLVDDYTGDWISNDESIYQLDFNGFGLYSGFGQSGSVTINDEKVPVTYSLIDSTLTGQFVYNGKIYTLTYDENANRIMLISGETQIEMERKDWFADKKMVDSQNREFVFDGKSSLLNGGTFTFDGKTYGYKESANGYTVTENGQTVGSIKRSERTYDVTIHDQTYALYVANDLMGNWAIGGEFSSLSIGPTDLQETVKANFKGFEVTLTYYSSSILTFKYKDAQGQPLQYYIYRIDEKTIALSQYTDLFSGEYSICSKADELFGTWTRGNTKISFDGLSSDYANGTAKITVTLMGKDVDTLYYYSIKEEGVLMWSQEALNGEYIYFKITHTDNADDSEAFWNGEKGIIRTEVDSLCLTKAKDSNGVTYIFDGLGTLTGDNGKSYSYTPTAFNANQTANITLTDETGKEYEAILNYQDNTNVTLTISEK